MNLTSKLYKIVLPFTIVIFFSFQSATTANVEKLFMVSKTKATTEVMVKEILSMYKKRYPKISINTWENIEKEINYENYYNKIKQIYVSNYTESEIKELIKLYNPKTMDKYSLKTKKVEQKLYEAGKDFGKELSPSWLEHK